MKRRAAAAAAVVEHGHSERHACVLVGIPRSTKRYASVKKPDEEMIRERLRGYALKHTRWGMDQFHHLLRRVGIMVNHKRTERLYRLERLYLRNQPKPRRRPHDRRPPTAPTRVNQVWSMDFMYDRTRDGRRLKVLTVGDDCTKGCLGLPGDRSVNGAREVTVSDRMYATRGHPRTNRVDNGPKFSGKEPDAWAYDHGMKREFIEPGKPQQNAFRRSFNGRLRGTSASTGTGS